MDSTSQGETFRCDVKLKLPNEEQRWINIFGGKIPYLQNTYAGVSFDITEEKQTELRLIESNEFTKAILDNSPDCVKVINCNGNIELMNINGCKLMKSMTSAKYKGAIGHHYGQMSIDLQSNNLSKLRRSVEAVIFRHFVQQPLELPNGGM